MILSRTLTLQTTYFKGAQPPPAAPVNQVAPSVSGPNDPPVVGDMMTCSSGQWTGFPTPSFTYQWNHTDGISDTPISGATDANYTLTDDDVGHGINCTVTATNIAGSASADSNATASVE